MSNQTSRDIFSVDGDVAVDEHGLKERFDKYNLGNCASPCSTLLQCLGLQCLGPVRCLLSAAR